MDKRYAAVGLFLAYLLARSASGASAAIPPQPPEVGGNPLTGSGSAVLDENYVRQLVDQINASEFGNWFDPLNVMAIIKVESNFDPNTFRYEPRLHDASYGLMQVLSNTARQFGFNGPATALYDPLTNITIGMRFMQWNFNYLAQKLGRAPYLDEWIAAYNQGAPSVAINGVQVAQYVNKFSAAYSALANDYTA